MPVTPSYRAWIEELLGRGEPVRTRAMFGGVGIYARGLFFGLVDDDRLYFKVDDATRPDFEAEGSTPFDPFGDPGRVMQYYEVPDRVLEDPEELETWMRKAVSVAERARPRK